MPNAHISNTRPSGKVRSTIPSATRKETAIPRLDIGNNIPSGRVTAGRSQTTTTPGTGVTFGGLGFPIGILLSIPYIAAQGASTPATSVTVGELAGPRVRIA